MMLCLIFFYIHLNKSHSVIWSVLVFTIPELEKQPLTRVLPQETFIQPKPGTADWSTATEEMIKNYESGMAAIRRKANERRMLLLPDFAAFDP
ncbi:unnamed protein product [Trichobilharzia regenti]|nr:unnamed protein product [Trichobilharzia regenti]